MLESAAKAAGLAIKNFFEGVGCEIASWFGSSCKDRMVDAEVTQQENVERDAAFTIPIATIWLPKRSEPPPPANLAVRDGRRPAPQRRHPQRQPRRRRRRPPPRSTRSRTSAASPAPRRLRVTAFGREETFDGIAWIIGNFGAGDDTLNVLEGVFAVAEATGDDGDDAIGYFGSGSATISGGNDNDVIIVGPDARGSASLLNGNDGNDVLVNNSAIGGTLKAARATTS